MMSRALALRIVARTRAERIRPVTHEETQSIITDWCAGESRQALVQRYKRGLKVIRAIIVKSQSEAAEVLSLDRTGNYERD